MNCSKVKHVNATCIEAIEDIHLIAGVEQLLFCAAAKEELHLHPKVMPDPVKSSIWQRHSPDVGLQEVAGSTHTWPSRLFTTLEHGDVNNPNKAVRGGGKQLLHAADDGFFWAICLQCLSQDEEDEKHDCWLQKDTVWAP